MIHVSNHAAARPVYGQIMCTQQLLALWDLLLTGRESASPAWEAGGS